MISDYPLQLTAWSPNSGYCVPVEFREVTNNLYTLVFPFENIGDQLDSEITPLRVQWAAEEGKLELDSRSVSWQRYKQLYGMQFGEQKIISLYAPELSFEGTGPNTVDKYNFGRYLRLVYLYVKPQARAEFEQFVLQFIVPAAEKILTRRDEVTGAPPPERRTYWRLPNYMRIVSMNVDMPTIPEFELFVQQHFLSAAQMTNTPLLTYRTVSGNRYNYHMLFPHDSEEAIQHQGDSLIASALFKKHELLRVAKRKRGEVRYRPASTGEQDAEFVEATRIGDGLSSEFHGHVIEMEEIVYGMRPDMSALLGGRYSKESVNDVWARYKANVRDL